MIKRKDNLLRFVSIIFVFILIQIGVFESFAGKKTFAPTFSIEETYNENIFYLDIYKASDFILTLSADFPFDFSDPTNHFRITYSPFAEFYRDYDQLNYIGHRFRSVYDYKGQTSNFSISDSFSLTQNQGEILEFQELPIGVSRRTDIMSNYFDLFYGYRIRSVSLLNFNFSHGLTHYDDLPGFDFEDTQEFTAGIENLYMPVNIRNQIGYFYTFSKFLFEDLQDWNTQSFGFVYKYDFPEKLEILFRAGAYIVSEEDYTDDSNLKPLFYFGMSKPFRRASLRLSLSKGAAVSRGFSGLSNIYRYYLGFSYRLTEKAAFRISTAYLDREPLEETAVEYDAFTVNSDLDFRIFRKFSISLGHRYFIQDSKNSDDFNARYNVYSLTFRFYPIQKSF